MATVKALGVFVLLGNKKIVDHMASIFILFFQKRVDDIGSKLALDVNHLPSRLLASYRIECN